MMEIAVFLVLVSLTVLAAGDRRIRLCPPNLDLCGDICYDSWNQTCCGRKLIQIGSGERCCNGVVQATGGAEDLECCHRKLYNWREMRCCANGDTIPIEYECCKNAPNGYINGREKICCDGNPIKITAKVNGCCGGEGYNRNTAKCCTGGGNSSLLSIDDALNHGQCCMDKISDYGRIIRSIPYDDRRNICCGGRLVKLTKQCCGHTVISDQELCCSGVPVRKKSRGSDACCYNPQTNYFDAYNSKHQLCDRTGHIRTHSEIENSSILRSLLVQLNNCGRRTYNATVEICCRGLIHRRRSNRTACCGIKASNIETDLCCNGRLRRGKKKDHRCCGRDVIGPTRTKKCPNRRQTQDDCHRRGFDSTMFRCCDGIVKRYYSPDEKCCGWDLYDVTKEKCCRRHFVLPKQKSCHSRRWSRFRLH